MSTATGTVEAANPKLLAWLEEVQAMCEPDEVRWCDGSQAEYQEMANLLVDTGTAMWLNQDTRENSLLVRSDPADVARVEDRTFICSTHHDDAGPTNNWSDPAEMKSHMRGLYQGCMKGRTMFVVPYSMGPIGSPIAKIGIILTDSAYVVCNMHIMARVGSKVLEVLGDSEDFVRGIHSVGYPLTGEKQPDLPWPCDAENKYITHYPESREIWSYGSGYGGNALLGKKCHALRIASVQARDEGWMAEHMLILKLTSPEGAVKFVAAAFPSACGKTNLAMMEPTLPGWKVETVGDDIAWMKFGEDGRLYAINPEAGFFGVAPGTGMETNPNAIRTLRGNSIFTNCALTRDGDVYWEGIQEDEPDHLVDWLRRPWEPGCGRTASHPNARFTAPASQCPVIAPEWEDPKGVPIDAILFGGRRAKIVPLVTEALNWRHGTFLGSIMSSEKTAAAAGKVGVVRRDPMAMLPFCGYHMGDYFAHWIRMGEKAGAGDQGWGTMPRVFYVNWFRKSEDGRWLWPGFGENGRVLKWIFERCDDQSQAEETPIGRIPAQGALDLDGLDLPAADLDELLAVDVEGWQSEMHLLHEHYAQFEGKLPPELAQELQAFEQRLKDAAG